MRYKVVYTCYKSPDFVNPGNPQVFARSSTFYGAVAEANPLYKQVNKPPYDICRVWIEDTEPDKEMAWH